MALVFILLFAALNEGGFSNLKETYIPSIERTVHNNNNLWTALDKSGGDVGSVSGPSMQFPGETGINTLYQGCQAIGFHNGTYPVVIATQLC
ncbi:hypothetical protein JW890_04285 [candidate division WOR-3 bacterium]|nr:hypothetical protein [candidate division WOR-3 bacterium]